MKLDVIDVVGYIESIDMSTTTFALQPLREMISKEFENGTPIIKIYGVLEETKTYLNDKLRKSIPEPNAKYKAYNVFVTQALQISNIITEIDLLITSLVKEDAKYIV